MRLAELPDGAVVFLDANVLAYHYTGLVGPLHDAASSFLINIRQRELHAARPIRRQHGLMTNDSILLSVMQSLKIRSLATNDPDFERVPDITI